MANSVQAARNEVRRQQDSGIWTIDIEILAALFFQLEFWAFKAISLERVALSVGCRGKGYWYKRVDRAPRLSNFSLQKRESG
jgi:hypothetical protein